MPKLYICDHAGDKGCPTPGCVHRTPHLAMKACCIKGFRAGQECCVAGDDIPTMCVRYNPPRLPRKAKCFVWNVWDREWYWEVETGKGWNARATAPFKARAGAKLSARACCRSLGLEPDFGEEVAKNGA